MKSTIFVVLCCLSGAISICTDECVGPGTGVADGLAQNLVDAVKSGECSLYNSELWPQDYAEQVLLDGGVNEVFDYVIVGSGSAGSIVASRLTENPNIKVLVLETGGDPPKESEMSLTYSLLRTQYMINDYSTQNPNSCQALIGESCYFPSGKMIGGSGGTNANLFLRGSRESYNGWQHSGNPGWSWHDVQQYFSKAKEQRGTASNPIGGLTLNYMQPLPENQPLDNMFYWAALEMGLPLVENFEGWRDIGITNNVLTTTEKGRRMSTGKTYLAKVAHTRSNLKVIKNAYTEKIRFNQFNTAVGVDFSLNQGLDKFTVNINKEVILSSGALGSPKILMHSGIGPSDHLQSLGIPVIKNLQVGKNLQDQGVMPFFFKIIRGKFTPDNEHTELPNILNYFVNSKGPLANPNTLVAYINSDPHSHSPYPDMQITTPMIISPDDRVLEKAFRLKPEIYQSIQSVAGNSQMLVIFTTMLKPHTRGSLSLGSTNVFDSPRIDYEFGQHPADKATILRFVRYLQRMQRTSAFKAYDIKMILPPLPQCNGLAHNSDAYWLCYAKYFLLASWSPAGTCKMGPQNDPAAVVDARLRVHGVQGVRVIDTSIMPTVNSGNSNGPTVMIGEKGAHMVLQDRQ